MLAILAVIGPLLGVVLGAALTSLFPFLIKRREERNDARVAKVRITSPLVGCMSALQAAYSTRLADIELLVRWMSQYSQVARESESLKYLPTREIKWALNTATLFDAALAQIAVRKWEAAEADPFGRSSVSPEVAQLMLAWLAQSVNALHNLGESMLVKKNISPEIVPLLNQLNAQMRGQMNQVEGDSEEV